MVMPFCQSSADSFGVFKIFIKFYIFRLIFVLQLLKITSMQPMDQLKIFLTKH